MALQTVGDWLKADAGVTALVDQRTYSIQLPERVSFPCIGIQRLSTDPLNHLQGHAGLNANTVIVDVYALKYTEALAVKEAAWACLYGNGVVCDAEAEDYDSSVKLYRITSQWSVFT